MIRELYILLTFLLYTVGIPVMLCGGLILHQMSVWFVGFCITAIGCGFYLKSVRCPHCGKYALRLRPFASNAGYCPRCGGFVEYF